MLLNIETTTEKAYSSFVLIVATMKYQFANYLEKALELLGYACED